VERISCLAGHSGTTTTEIVYRKQLRPVLLEGAGAMDRIFPEGSRMLSYSLSYSVTIKGRLLCLQVASELVGVAGFEPAASSSRTKRAAKLRHTPPTARAV
jgi:hypothetical protein